ncbi:MAG: hypothetical protein WBA43_02115 [Elainellaceae cyanobacterium]
MSPLQSISSKTGRDRPEMASTYRQALTYDSEAEVTRLLTNTKFI